MQILVGEYNCILVLGADQGTNLTRLCINVSRNLNTIIMNAEFHTCFHRELGQEWRPRRTPGCGASDGRAPLEPRLGEIAPERLPLGGWVEQLAARTPLHVMLPGHHDQEFLCPSVMKGDFQTHDL